MIYLKNTLYISLLLFFSLAASVKASILLPADVQHTIDHPFHLNLIVEKKRNTSYRLVLPILQIGSKQVHLKTVFDTGSEGLILDASTLLPAEMITPEGIVMNGQNSIVINNITITAQQDSASYGDTKEKKRHYYGNIAYSTIVIGDENGHVTTRKMPFLLIYKGVKDATQKPVKLDKTYDGICGVYSSYVSNDDLAMTRKQLKSPFDYINYAPGIRPGFMLSPIATYKYGGNGLFNRQILTIGVTDQSEAGFFKYQQDFSNGKYSPAVVLPLSWGDESIRTSVLFDTGTPISTFLLHSKFTNLQKVPDQTLVQFNIPDFPYSYTVFNGITTTYSGPGKMAITSLHFFDSFYYQLDYQNHTICFLAKQQKDPTLF